MAVAGEYNYRLPRCALPEVRDLLFALPRNDPSREARNGKVLGRTPTFDRDQGYVNFHAGRARFFVEKEKRGRFGGKDGHRGESPGCGYRGLFCDGAER